MKSIPLSPFAAVLVAGLTLTPTAQAFDPQPDPPAFGPVSMLPAQTLRLAVFCAHAPRGVDTISQPCVVNLHMMNADGRVLSKVTRRVEPGSSTYLDYAVAPALAGVASPRLIIPCVEPDPESGEIVPTVQVFDTVSGATRLYTHAAPARSFHAHDDGGAVPQ
jgi:hypothetical protein